jgi:hypothetical protein
MRLITARSSVSRNKPGPGIAGWGSGVTVPDSTKPKPKRQHRVRDLRILVEARGKPDGLGKIDARDRIARSDRRRRGAAASS